MLTLAECRSDEREVRTGTLTCSACRSTFAVADGIADLLCDAPDYVVREAAGLDRFAELMRMDGWDRDKIMRLPDIHNGYWVAQRKAIDHVLQTGDFKPGERLLDVGSNTCWASNILARAGLDVIALDIATTLMQGLKTADWFLESGEVYFERVLSTMSAPAIASESMDYVFCCEVLHHNDAPHLRRTLAEIFRVLKPGGRLFIVNEPMRFMLDRKHDHAQEVAAFEGNEHVYDFHEYWRAVRAAGFTTAKPWLRGLPTGKGADGPHRLPARHPLAPLERAVRRRALGRGAIAANRVARYAWYHIIRGDRSLLLDCTKPGDEHWRTQVAGRTAKSWSSPRKGSQFAEL